MRRKTSVCLDFIKQANLKNLIFYFFVLFSFVFQMSYAQNKSPSKNEEKYTINFEKVSLLEYVRFVGKVSNVNFLFNEEDLQFDISIISEDAMDTDSLMSTLVQILRSHGLQIIEQDNNLLIHTNADVKQMAPLVTNDDKRNDPIVTRVFHIKNAKIETVSSVVSSMISAQALLQAMPDTRLLIVTDVTSNIKMIGELIEVIDASTTPIDFATYDAQINKPSVLVALTNQIMSPMVGGNPFLLVPNTLSGKVYVVSTPALIQKASAVLSSLDSGRRRGVRTLDEPQEMYIYKPHNKSVNEVFSSLKSIANNLAENPNLGNDLTETIDSAQVLQEPPSILFVGDKYSLEKLKELLAFIDVPIAKSTFFIYHPKFQAPPDILHSVQEIGENLEKTKSGEIDLIKTLEGAKIMPSTQAIVFIGPKETFPTIKELLSTVDVEKKVTLVKKPTFFIYKIKNVPEEQLTNALLSFANNLKKSDISEKDLIQTIQNAKYIKETHSLVFTGPEEALNTIKELLPTFDEDLSKLSIQQAKLPSKSKFFIYHPVNADGKELEHSLKEISNNLANAGLTDPSFLQTIQSMKWVPTTRSLLFTGDENSLNRVESLLKSLDTPQAVASRGKSHFFLYPLQNTTGNIIEDDLENFVHQLKAEKVPNQSLIHVLETAKWVKETNSILLTGDPNAIDAAKEIIAKYDVKREEEKAPVRSHFFLYPLQNISGNIVEEDLNNLVNQLKSAKAPNQKLINVLKSTKWVKETNSILLTGDAKAIDEAKEIIAKYDVKRKEEKASVHQHFLLYKPKYVAVEEIEKAIKETAIKLENAKLSDPNFLAAISSMKYVPATNSLVFTGDENSLNRIQALLEAIDTAHPAVSPLKAHYFLYPLQNAPGNVIEEDLKNFVQHLKAEKVPNKDLITVLESAKWVKETNSILLTGDPDGLEKAQAIIAKFDVKRDEKISAHQHFLLFKPKFTSPEEMEKAIKETTNKLENAKLSDPNFLAAISSMKYIPATHSFAFTGDENSLNRIEPLLQSLDAKEAIAAPTKPHFFLYPLKYAPGNIIEEDLDSLVHQLKEEKVPNLPLINVLESAKWVKETNSILLTGDPNTIELAKEIIEKYDVKREEKVSAHQHFLLYKPKYISPDEIEKAMKETAINLENAKLSDPNFLAAISSMKYIPTTHSFAFTGDDVSLQKIQKLLFGIDIPTKEVIKTKGPSNFFIYKPQYVSHEQIEISLHEIASNLEKAKLADPDFLKAITSMSYNTSTNSLSFTGDQNALDKIQALIKTIDIEEAAPKVPKAKEGPEHFFLYKPKYLPAKAIEHSLTDIAANLEKANLADPNFLNAISSMKYVASTNSIAFTGSPSSLKRIEELLATIDLPTPKEKIEPSAITYLIYPLHSANAQVVINAMRSITEDLTKSGAADPQFVSALQSMKYKKENHSLMFTGTQAALDHVKRLVEKFDLEKEEAPAALGDTPSTFFVYKPKYLSGPSIESILQDFAEHLKMSGMSNPALFHSIMSMKWNNKTKSLYFTGTQKVIDEIKHLLSVFDIPDQKEIAEVPTDNLPIVDNTSFLVYKLQYHKGDEIQAALKQIALDLSKTKALADTKIVTAIQSVQWIQVTNTLLCSGDPDAMQKLKALIKSLDVPLKQVFIEMLVLETSLNNNMSFGLDWGSKFQYKDQLTGAVGNYQPLAQGVSSPSGFAKNMDAVNAGGVASSDIPTGSGFDLGVIGDLIRYNGRAFLSLGSLISALQQDDESTIVMTPKLLTQDGKVSKIFIGQNIPFTGSVTTNTTSSTLQTTSIEYRDIGMGVTITPFLGNNDVVTLSIDLEATAAISQIGQASTVSGLPTTKTSMNTTVHIPNKNFLILSGMANETSKRNKSGVPCLGGLPWLGAAFSQTSDSDTRDNIVIFIRPHIINSYKDMARVTKTQETYFSEQTGTQTLENSFNEKMELIKSYDDE